MKSSKYRPILNILILLCISTLAFAGDSPIGTWDGTLKHDSNSVGTIHQCTFYQDGTTYIDWSLNISPSVTVSDETYGSYIYSQGVLQAGYAGTAVESGGGTSTTYNLQITNGNINCDDASGNYRIDFTPAPGWPAVDIGTWMTTRNSMPEKAFDPNPEHQTEIEIGTATLSWSETGVCQFDVYFGVDFDDVRDASTSSDEYQGRFSQAQLETSPLFYCTTYYWRVDTVNINGVTEGDIWWFVTPNDIGYLGPIDFEVLQMFSSYWLYDDCDEFGWCQCTDLNADRRVTFDDYAVLAGKWSEDYSLIGHWRLNSDAPDTNVPDNSHRANHGTAARNTSLLHTDSGNPPYLDGAFSFNGATDYITIPDHPEWDFGDGFTICLWVNFDSFNNDWWEAAFLGHDEGPYVVPKWIFSYDPMYERTVFHIHGPDTNGPILKGEPWTAEPGTWYFVCVTRYDQYYDFYLNGSANGSKTNTDIIPDISAPLTIGWAEGPATFHGKIDDVRIYNRALEPSEIAELYDIALNTD